MENNDYYNSLDKRSKEYRDWISSKDSNELQELVKENEDMSEELDHVPNALTRKTIEDAEKGIGIEEVANVDELFKELEENKVEKVKEEEIFRDEDYENDYEDELLEDILEDDNGKLTIKEREFLERIDISMNSPIQPRGGYPSPREILKRARLLKIKNGE